MRVNMRVSLNERLVWAVSASILLAAISCFSYNNLPILISIKDETAVHYKQLERIASAGRPWWRSLDTGSNLNRMKAGWKDDQTRRAAEMRARLDEEVPLKFPDNKVISTPSTRLTKIILSSRHPFTYKVLC